MNSSQGNSEIIAGVPGSGGNHHARGQAPPLIQPTFGAARLGTTPSVPAFGGGRPAGSATRPGTHGSDLGSSRAETKFGPGALRPAWYFLQPGLGYTCSYCGL